MRALLTIILSICFIPLYAGKIDFNAALSHSIVEVGQRFKVTFSVNSTGGNFTPPNFSPLRVLAGPNQSQQVQYINGKRSQQTKISYILAAGKAGTYKIGNAKIIIDGELYRSKALEVEVVKSNNRANTAKKKDKKAQNNQKLFLRAIVDKQNVYIGEKLTVTYKLYSKVGINGLDLEKAPDLNGFWSHDIEDIYDDIQFKRERIDGEIYQTSKLQQSVLYPQRAGTLVIDPMKLKLAINVRSRRAQSIFDQMFGQRKEVIVSSRPIEIEVKRLPSANKTAFFTGAVGDFNIVISSNKDSVKANEAIDLTLTIRGKGNLPFIAAPKLNLPPDFEVYDPEISNNYKTNYNGASGAKVFKYLIIPRHEGNYIIDPYTFSYFDLESQSYKTIQTDTLAIHVDKGKADENLVYRGNRKEDIELLGKDIRYIHLQNLSLTAIDQQFYGSTTFYLLIILFLLLLIALWYFSKKRKQLNSDQVGLRRTKANKLAKKRLSKAKKHLEAKAITPFYEEISAALYGYYSDKFNIELAELSLDKILSLLGNEEAVEQLKSDLKSALEEADMARFAKSSNVDASKLYEKAVKIISQTENLKKV